MHRHGNPATRRLAHFFLLDTEESRYRRAREIDVEDADGVALQRQRQRELGGNARFADPAFAREHEDNVAYVFERHSGVYQSGAPLGRNRGGVEVDWEENRIV